MRLYRSGRAVMAGEVSPRMVSGAPRMATFRHGHFPRKEVDGDRKTPRPPHPYMADDIPPLGGTKKRVQQRKKENIRN